MSLDTLEIKCNQSKNISEIIFLVNGKNFEQIVKDYELEHFSEDPAAGGGYAPINTPYWDGENYFLRSSQKNDFLDDDGEALLLTCDCGEWGCWNIFCTITVTEKTVVWDTFKKHHRDWKYDLRYEFEKEAYFKQFDQLPTTLIEISN